MDPLLWKGVPLVVPTTVPSVPYDQLLTILMFLRTTVLTLLRAMLRYEP